MIQLLGPTEAVKCRIQIKHAKMLAIKHATNKIPKKENVVLARKSLQGEVCGKYDFLYGKKN